MNEEELLSSLEESFDYNHGGFVSSFTLPMTNDGGGGGGEFRVRFFDVNVQRLHPCSMLRRYFFADD
jgi:uncharacterized membrane protein